MDLDGTTKMVRHVLPIWNYPTNSWGGLPEFKLSSTKWGRSNSIQMGWRDPIIYHRPKIAIEYRYTMIDLNRIYDIYIYNKYVFHNIYIYIVRIEYIDETCVQCCFQPVVLISEKKKKNELRKISSPPPRARGAPKRSGNREVLLVAPEARHTARCVDPWPPKKSWCQSASQSDNKAMPPFRMGCHKIPIPPYGPWLKIIDRKS